MKLAPSARFTPPNRLSALHDNAQLKAGLRRKARALAFALLPIAGPGFAAPSAYIANYSSNTVSVIDVATRSVTHTIPVGVRPTGVAVTPDGTRAYVANYDSHTVSVISTETNTVIATIPVSGWSYGVAVTPDGSHVYVADHHASNVSVISTATNTVVANISVFKPFLIAISPNGGTAYVTCGDCNTLTAISTATNSVVGSTTVGWNPVGVDVSPDGSKVYVASSGSDTVSVVSTDTGAVTSTIPVSAAGAVAVSPSGDKVYVGTANNAVAVISTATNTVDASIPVGTGPRGIALTSDGASVYVAKWDSNDVSIISTATNTVSATVGVGSNPYSMGKFIQQQRYEFTGFHAPVDNAPMLNVMKAGAAVPVKFSLGGDKGLDIMAAGSPASRQVYCDGSAGSSAVEETVTAGGSSLNYDPATTQYTYVWKTQKEWANTCREFNLKLNDSSDHKAVFHFTR